MALTYSELQQVVRGVSKNPSVEPALVVNQAGRFLVGMHPWKWRERPQLPLNAIAPITITDGTWTEASKTLTKTGAFTNYTYRNAELITISDGTNATTGTYVVAGKTNANAITLTSSIGSTADGETDIDGEINFPYYVMPDDFGSQGGGGQIVDLVHKNALVQYTVVDTPSYIRYLRNADINSSLHIWYAITFPGQLDYDSAMPVPLLECYPTPAAVDVGQVHLSYRAGWTELSNQPGDTRTANVPGFMEHLLVRMVKAFAQEGGSDDGDRIAEVIDSREMKKVMEMDAGHQANFGMSEGGILQSPRHLSDFRWNTQGAATPT